MFDRPPLVPSRVLSSAFSFKNSNDTVNCDFRLKYCRNNKIIIMMEQTYSRKNNLRRNEKNTILHKYSSADRFSKDYKYGKYHKYGAEIANKYKWSANDKKTPTGRVEKHNRTKFHNKNIFIKKLKERAERFGMVRKLLTNVPNENERVGLNESGVFDKEIYGGKGKFEGYVTSIATKEADDEDEEDNSANSGGRQRSSYTAPLSLLNDVVQSNEDYDVFGEHKRPTIASRESEYQKARRNNMQISPARVDFFADGGKTPEVGARGYAQIMKEQANKTTEADYRKQMAEKAKDGTLKAMEETNGASKSAAKRRGRWDQTADETPKTKKPAAAFFAAESATPSSITTMIFGK